MGLSCLHGITKEKFSKVEESFFLPLFRKGNGRLNAYSIQETLQPGHKGWIIRSLDITTRNETSFESRFKARIKALP